MNGIEFLIKSKLWSDIFRFENVVFSKRIKNDIPYLREIYSKEIFNDKQIQAIHKRRVDKETGKRLPLKFTRDTLTLKLYESKDGQKFFKFGCFFINYSNNLYLNGDDFWYRFSLFLRFNHLNQHFSKSDCDNISLKYYYEFKQLIGE